MIADRLRGTLWLDSHGPLTVSQGQREKRRERWRTLTRCVCVKKNLAFNHRRLMHSLACRDHVWKQAAAEEMT